MSRDSPRHTLRPPFLRYSGSGRGRSLSYAQNTPRRLPVIRQLPNPLFGDGGRALTARVSRTSMPIILRSYKNIPQIRKYSIYNFQGKCKSLSAKNQFRFHDGHPPGRLPEKPTKGRRPAQPAVRTGKIRRISAVGLTERRSAGIKGLNPQIFFLTNRS